MAKSIPDFTILFSHGGLWLKVYQISLYFLATGSVAKSISDFTILFSHEGLWLKSISDFTILFSHEGLWLKSISDFSILLATAVCAKKYIRFQYTF